MNMNWHDLIQRYISGTITEAETEALEQQLKTDVELRDWYLDAVNLDSTLELTAESDPPHRGTSGRWHGFLARGAEEAQCLGSA